MKRLAFKRVIGLFVAFTLLLVFGSTVSAASASYVCCLKYDNEERLASRTCFKVTGTFTSSDGSTCNFVHDCANCPPYPSGYPVNVPIVSGNVPIIVSGSGSPNGVVTAVVGSVYLRTDGGANTSIYVKESGTGNTGWVAK